MAFTVSSTSFSDGDCLNDERVMSEGYGFGCAGGNRSPHLRWEGAPAGTRSFAVTCYDPDAPTGSGFWHWVVANIPGHITELVEGAGDLALDQLPEGALAVRNDTGKADYAGPCPPQGDEPHHYIFTVFAVSSEQLPVTAETSPAVVGFNLHFTTLEKATIMGLYKR
jgi:Raf kinase inhibitor-like YbhB/YbcL family protein